MKHFLSKVKKYGLGHKKTSVVAILAVIIIIYYILYSLFSTTASPQYILGKVHKGTISQTVTGSGQVSSENQLDITSEVSGKVISIKSVVGQKVKTGDIIATLDSGDAFVDLQNARISYAKLTKPAKEGDIANAKNNLTKSYSDAFGSISNTFLHTPTIISGLKDLFTSRDGYLSDQNSTQMSETGKSYRWSANVSYGIADNDYAKILIEYNNLTKTSATSSIESMISKTYDFIKKVSEALKDAQSAITYISTNQPEYNTSGSISSAVNIKTWSEQINNDLSSLLGAKNSIASNNDTLQKLTDGADVLDIQAEKLSLQQKEKTYSKYFIKAPFEGVIGRIPVHIYEQANNGTVIATISSNQKITNIPLNEVDAVKVENGQKVLLTFDAVSGIKVNGKVTQVDLVGTANQGVVTYNIKISFEADDLRIRPGMSIDAVITTKEKTGILVVPSNAVKSQGSGKNRNNYVEIFDSNEIPQKQIVTIGESDDINTEITGGLDEGQEIIVRTVVGGTLPNQSSTPTIFSSLGGSQRNIIQNANRTGATRTTNTTNTAR